MGSPVHNSRGMSLVEVLISMVISLVVTLAAYQTFAASEGYRRAATGGGDATFSRFDRHVHAAARSAHGRLRASTRQRSWVAACWPTTKVSLRRASFNSRWRPS